jgi:energy-coupling factor transport system ATP-binding protein
MNQPADLQSAAPPVAVQELTFRYRARTEPALDHVSLTLDRGELLLVAGTSGCGKTTLIRCINGLIPRSYKGEWSGRVLLNGQDLSGRPLAHVSRVVGTVLQDPERQILGARVSAEVAFGLENLGLPRTEIRERVRTALDHLGIVHLRDRETHLLSGGEKQKVALAGVLAMRPSVLLLDEPLASLDPASAQEALALIRRLADEGIGILLVEHRVEDALRICPDRVILMEEGHIIYDGSTEDMMEVADPRQVKLPAPIVMARARSTSPRSFVPTVQPDGRDPLVSFKEVSFGYGEDGPTVLHDVDLTVHQGDIIALLGPNGAGKTTLVKHAIGLLKPRRGTVRVEARDSQELSVAQIAHTLGYVFQSPSHMLFAPTVREELAFGPKNLGLSKEAIAHNVDRAVASVNLVGLEDYPPLGLSFGQQKRVSIAAILAMRSKILVMDEPTAGQDYANYRAFMDAILGGASSSGGPNSSGGSCSPGGKGSSTERSSSAMPDFEAVLFITHDLDLAIVYANRILLMFDGRIVADGPPAEVLADPDSLHRWRLVPTSLLELNLEYLPLTGRFLSAEALAHADL